MLDFAVERHIICTSTSNSSTPEMCHDDLPQHHYQRGVSGLPAPRSRTRFPPRRLAMDGSGLLIAHILPLARRLPDLSRRPLRPIILPAPRVVRLNRWWLHWLNTSAQTWQAYRPLADSTLLTLGRLFALRRGEAVSRISWRCMLSTAPISMRGTFHFSARSYHEPGRCLDRSIGRMMGPGCLRWTTRETISSRMSTHHRRQIWTRHPANPTNRYQRVGRWFKRVRALGYLTLSR